MIRPEIEIEGAERSDLEGMAEHLRWLRELDPAVVVDEATVLADALTAALDEEEDSVG